MASQMNKNSEAALQSGLVKGACKGGYRRSIALAFDRNLPSLSPIIPTMVEVSRHFDFVGCRLIQCKLSIEFIHFNDACLSLTG